MTVCRALHSPHGHEFNWCKQGQTAHPAVRVLSQLRRLHTSIVKKLQRKLLRRPLASVLQALPSLATKDHPQNVLYRESNDTSAVDGKQPPFLAAEPHCVQMQPRRAPAELILQCGLHPRSAALSKCWRHPNCSPGKPSSTTSEKI